MMRWFLRMLFRPSRENNGMNGLERIDDRKLKAIEWSLDMMHQNETKALGILGFYIALSGAIIGESEMISITGICLTYHVLIVLIIISIFCALLLFILFSWKSHYLEVIHILLRSLDFNERSLPTSLRWTIEEMDTIAYGLPFDRISLAIPIIVAVLCFCLLWFAH